MQPVTRRKAIAMGGLPVLAGVGAYVVGEKVLSAEERPRFQAVGPGTARETLQRRHLPNVALVTNDGRDVRFYDDLVKDRKVVLTFFSSRALADSRRVTANLSALQRFFGSRVGNDMFMYSIARDPERDTPAALRSWAVRSGAGRGWKFLSGEPADVQRLRQSLGFASPNPAEDADPRYAIGLLRHGVEPQMRWAHCQSLALPRVLAHSMLLDFGEGPADPSSPAYFRFASGGDARNPPIWNCKRLVAAFG